ncbi:MAG: hypothetical protein N2053_11285, partial [Chitinispirillaceae bacterium]|nr:hypothetical protein [Chitinispirillaceae bacterium]
MKKKFLIFVFLLSSYALCKVGIIVNRDLYQNHKIKKAIATYIGDLLFYNEKVWIDSTTFDHTKSREKLRQLRDSLRIHYIYDNLTGAVLIGNLPVASIESIRKEFHYDSTGKVIDSVWKNINYPTDYYFMNLTDSLDTAWHDDSTEENCGKFGYPFLSDYFEYYGSDNRDVEIWVSRVIAHNLYHTPTREFPFPEDSVIAAYFERVHQRMRGLSTIPRRALLVSLSPATNYLSNDYISSPDFEGIEPLNIPYVNFTYPYDKPSIWERELQKGYE